MDVQVEQMIKVTPPKTALLFKVVMVAACILAATTIPATYVLGLFLLIVFVIFTVLLFQYYNAEYEYSLVDNELTVDRIMARTMRRRCGVYNLGKAALIARFGSQDVLRMQHKQLKTFDYTAGNGTADAVVIYAYNMENEMVCIFIEPNEKMLEAIKRITPKGTYKVAEKTQES